MVSNVGLCYYMAYLLFISDVLLGTNGWIWYPPVLGGCLAMLASVETNELIGLLRRLWTETVLIPYSDLKPLIATHITSKWHHEWDENVNKLHEIEPSMKKLPKTHAGSRWDQVVLAASVLATHGLHMLSCSKGTLPLNVLGVSPHWNIYY